MRRLGTLPRLGTRGSSLPLFSRRVGSRFFILPLLLCRHMPLRHKPSGLPRPRRAPPSTRAGERKTTHEFRLTTSAPAQHAAVAPQLRRTTSQAHPSLYERVDAK